MVLSSLPLPNTANRELMPAGSQGGAHLIEPESDDEQGWRGSDVGWMDAKCEPVASLRDLSQI